MHEYDEFEITEDELQEKQQSWLRRHWKKLLSIILLIIVAGGVYIASNLLKVSVNPFDFGKLKGESEGRVNIMVLGVGDPGHAGEKLADTNVLVSVNTKTGQVAFIGVPRDLRVRYSKGGAGKINNAHAIGGIKESEYVFENTLDAPIHYYVRANFTGLKQVVDAVGGVDVVNDRALNDPEYPCEKNEARSCGFKLAAGAHHLDGKTALKYVRCRKGTCGDDFGRAERQQEVMQSARERAVSLGTLTNPVRLGQLSKSIGDNITTDLSINNVLRLNELTKNADKTKNITAVFSLNPDGFLISSGGSDLLPAGGSFTKIQAFVKNIFTVGPIWAEHPTMVIENGTSTIGLGTQLADKISDDGYNIAILAVQNALKRDYLTSQIIDYSGGKRPNTLAYLEKLLGVKATTPETKVKTTSADIKVIVGSDYKLTTGSSDPSSNTTTRSR